MSRSVVSNHSFDRKPLRGSGFLRRYTSRGSGGSNLAEDISELKRQPGKDIVISGSGALVRSLLKDGLLDELRLIVHPVVLGGGKRLFEEGEERTELELADSKTFATNVVYLTYRPEGKQGVERGRK